MVINAFSLEPKEFYVQERLVINKSSDICFSEDPAVQPKKLNLRF